MPDLDVLQIPNDSTEYALRDNRVPLNLTNAMLAVGADGNVLTQNSIQNKSGFTLYNFAIGGYKAYIFGTLYEKGTAELATQDTINKLRYMPFNVMDLLRNRTLCGVVCNIEAVEQVKVTFTAFASGVPITGTTKNLFYRYDIELNGAGIVVTETLLEDIDDTITSTDKTWSSTKINNELGNKANSADLASVATSGAYSDLTGTPSIPTNTSDLNNDSDYQTGTQVATTVSTKENVIPRLTGTLLAGQTSITISDTSIVDGSLLEYFVSDPSVMILSVNPTVGSVTLTFEAQASDLVVGVVVL